MSEEPAKRKRRFWGPRRWHRWVGAVFALPLLWLCVTGLLLQHQDDLGLTEKKVSSAWLLKRYGQIPEGEPRSATAGRFRVSEWGGLLFLDGVMLEESGVLVGAVAKPAELVVATTEELFVYGAQGEFLDRLGEESLPGVPLERVGLGPARELLLEVGGKSYVMSDDHLSFEAGAPEGALTWSGVSVDREFQAELQKGLAEGAGFTWARVVTDLHSGTLFGRVGTFLVDLSGIGVIVLTLFGIRLLFKPSARKT